MCVFEAVKKNIDEYGWSTLYIHDKKGHAESFTYTIGFEKSLNQPEIMIFGLKEDTMSLGSISKCNFLRERPAAIV